MLQSIIDSLKPYISLGAIGQKDGDQGDSSQRDGLFYALAGLLKAPVAPMGQNLDQGWQEAVKAHEAAPGLYRRSPDPSYWGYNPNNFSRDQHSILRIGMAVMGDKVRIKQSAWAMLKRLGFHQNYHIGTDTTGKWWHDYKIPDIMTPAEVSVIIRGLSIWYLYPVLVLLDLAFFMDLAIRKYGGLKHDSDNMLAINLLYANKKYMTPCSWLAMKLYKRTDFMSYIEKYYSEADGNNGIEPLAQLYKLAFDKLT